MLSKKHLILFWTKKLFNLPYPEQARECTAYFDEDFHSRRISDWPVWKQDKNSKRTDFCIWEVYTVVSYWRSTSKAFWISLSVANLKVAKRCFQYDTLLRDFQLELLEEIKKIKGQSYCKFSCRSTLWYLWSIGHLLLEPFWIESCFSTGEWTLLMFPGRMWLERNLRETSL